MSGRVTLPPAPEELRRLRAGERVLLTGPLYTARDAAHRRMIEALQAGGPLPVDLSGQVIYYAGPTPPRPGRAVGSCGPTTSERMDRFTPQLLERGVAGAIGKGPRGPEVCEAFRRHGAVYFVATGGAGALLARCIKSAEVVAYEDLGTEAIRRLYVEDFPVIVALDTRGGDVFGAATAR